MNYKVLNYSDFMTRENIKEFCQQHSVIFDFKLYDISNTMRRNVKTCAELGAKAVTVADDPGNTMGIPVAQEAGQDYGIEIIIGQIPNELRRP